MAEQQPINPLNVSDLIKQQQEVADKAQEIYNSVEEKFISSGYLQIVGNALFGNPTKTATDAQGNRIQAEWTTADILGQMKKMKDDEELQFRESMTEDLGAGFMAMDRFVTETESPLRHQSEGIINFAAVLLQRINITTKPVAETFPVGKSEEYIQAEVLEAVRRLLLRPTYILHEGIGGGGIRVKGYDSEDFWDEREDLITEEMRRAQANRDNETYFRLEKERIVKGLRDRNEDDWGILTQRISGIFLNYIKEAVQSTEIRLTRNLEFARGLVQDGKPLYSEEEKASLANLVARTEDVRSQIENIEHFEDLLPLIKEMFGQQASYEDLMQFLHVQNL